MFIKKIKGPIDDNALNNINHNFGLSDVLRTQINDLVLDSEGSNAEVAQARGGHQVLSDRLNKTDQQLAETAKKDEVQDLVVNKAEKEDVQHGLSLKRDKTVSIGLDDATPEFLAAVEGGEGTSFNLKSEPRDYSVTPITTTFIKTPDNLFNQRKNNAGYIINVPSGDLTYSPNYFVTDFIPANPLEDYIASAQGRWVYFNSSFNYLTTVDGVAQINTPEDTAFMRFRGLMENLANFQINKGSTLLPYDEHMNRLEDTNDNPFIIKPSINSVTEEIVAVDAITPAHEKHFEQSPNLFNEQTVLFDKNINFSGSIVDTQGRVLSDFIPVQDGQTYSKTPFPTLEISYFDQFKNFIKRADNVSSGTGSFTIESGIGVGFIRVSPALSSSRDLMINDGNTLLAHQPYGFKLVSTSQYPITIDEAIVPQSGGGGTVTVKNFDTPFLYESVSTLATTVEETVCTINEKCFVQSLELSSNTELAEIIIQIRQEDGTLEDYQLMKNDGSGYVPITLQNLFEHGSIDFLWADFDTNSNIYKVQMKDKQYGNGVVVKIKNNDTTSKNVTCRVEGGTYV